MCGCVFPARKSVDAYLPLLNQFHLCPLWTLHMLTSVTLTVTKRSQRWIGTVSSLPRWVGPRGRFSALWTWRSPETRVLRRPGWTEHCSRSWGTPRLSSGLFFSPIQSQKSWERILLDFIHLSQTVRVGAPCGCRHSSVGLKTNTSAPGPLW